MPRRISEADTRKEMIDLQFEKAGWYLRDHSKVRIEIPKEINEIVKFCNSQIQIEQNRLVRFPEFGQAYWCVAFRCTCKDLITNKCSNFSNTQTRALCSVNVSEKPRVLLKAFMFGKLK
jgi:hypothetical protein